MSDKYTYRMQPASTRGRRFSDHDAENTLDEIVHVQGEGFRNCGGSGVDEGRWLRHYRGVMGEKGIIYDCSVGGCQKVATDGGHVLFDERSGVFLLPICHKHNDPRRSNYYHCVAEYAVKLYNESG
ncbi:hypothetical protein TSOC_004377 [Tetrabaena socialis]|uniref:Uncharacterized protein n=1 Tax=Tetrabaena socialis TaxID=47790 RepID=A0A2J8A951_9CHLO|nr:hypothetical protein TSOC_004377 [Tetrabaena socialis]|eukprot:PNH09058.1 hypothetical protein TSOC_004377 [Tetrabaena socialis]